MNAIKNYLVLAVLLFLPVVSSAWAQEDLVAEYRRRFALLEQDGPLDAILDRTTWPKHDLLASYLELELLFHPNYGVTNDRLETFLEKWPHHAQADRVARLMEQRVMQVGGTMAENWFAKHPPKQQLARLQHVGGLLKRNLVNEAYVWWRDLYREGADVFSLVAEDHPFWSKLVLADHETRVRTLLNNGASSANSSFKSTLRLLPDSRQTFFQAMEVARKGESFSSLLKGVTLSVPESQELMRQRFEALNRQDAKSRMLELLAGPEGKQLAMEDRQRWRYIFGRSLLFLKRDYKGAYALLNENVREKGAALEDSVWLAGWSALNDQNQERAATLFQQLAKEGVTPQGRSQGAYWAARLIQNPEQKQPWLNLAAKSLDNIYGLLAKEELAGSVSIGNEEPSCPEANSGGKLAPVDLEGLSLLEQVGRAWYNGPEIQKLGDRLGLLPEERLCLAIRYGAADLSIKLASELNKKDRVFWRGLFPVPKWRPDSGWQLSEALIWATSRQESQFFPRAESSAKALGVMQLMPDTASYEAKLSNFPVSTRLRLQIPGYNIALGQAYMRRMLKQFDGDLVLALIAYNAGPSRAKAWSAQRRLDDPLTFIENIPITETRTYVKRVLTGLGIYRLHLTGVASMKADMASGGPGLEALAPVSKF
ncbi:MAG: transglycosylase SLT domain-containing protein [Magnetococcales bacterium]|nr:transglycosylase SLT domain-containing protein [Magnetococcales bacterium]